MDNRNSRLEFKQEQLWDALMRRFVDLHLSPPIQDLDRIERVVNRSAELGYSLVGVPLSTGTAKDSIEKLRSICAAAKMDFAKRIDLTPRTPRELLRLLRRVRRRFEVVSVMCGSKAVARQAAKDRRVDLLSFSVTNLHRRFFDQAEAELASKALSGFEIDITPLLELTGFQRVHLISRLRREVGVASKFNVPLIISSGASKPDQLRSPRDCAALASLFDLDAQFSLDALSEIPSALVERNRRKLSPEYLAPGVHIVKRRDK